VKLHVDQLAEHLKKRPAPIYLVSGDEPLQMTETADAIRRAARASGFVNRELFYADNNFDWSALDEAGNSLSLFGEQRLLDVRLPSKPDKAAAAALTRYAERPADDAVLVVSTAKIGGADQKSRWFQAIDKAGVVIQIWPIEGDQLLRWLDRRLAKKGLLADRSGVKLLAGRVEGNLLAAAQEVEKLHILYGEGKIDDRQIAKAVADSARYDVFDLAEEILKGHAGKICRILGGLKAEGVAPAVVLWAVTREIRLINGLSAMLAKGASSEAAFSKFQVWDKRKAAVNQALQRLTRDHLHRALAQSAKTDRIIKGVETGDPWDELLTVCLGLAAGPRERASGRIGLA
jgi:DNA polymerase-3 subunit delta